jgi:hypothetical protein
MSKPRQTRGGHVLLGADGDAARLMTPDAGEEPYSFWGFTDHFEIYLAHNLFTSGVDGVLTASAIKDRCEDDYNRLQHLFSGVDIDDLPFQIHLRPGKHGGTHDGCDSTSIYCDVDPNDNDNFIRFELVAEVAEVFMDAVGKGWDCSRSNGEGLSRVLAADAYPQPQQTSLGIPGFFTAWSWLNGPRLNFVNQNDQSDQNYPSIGCAALFLNYLRFQLGFSWRQIVRSDGQFLVGAFNLLTGRTDAFDSFSSLVARRFPVGGNADLATDNPFPIRPDLLFYDAAGGVGQFYASDMSGDITLLSTYTDWRTTWTSIVPLHFHPGSSRGPGVLQRARRLRRVVQHERGELQQRNGTGQFVETDEVAERDAEILRLLAQGRSYQDIVDMRLPGIANRGAVSKARRRALDAIRAPAVAEYRAMALAELDALSAGAWDDVRAPGPKVSGTGAVGEGPADW